jgi:hypothetical protein
MGACDRRAMVRNRVYESSFFGFCMRDFEIAVVVCRFFASSEMWPVFVWRCCHPELKLAMESDAASVSSSGIGGQEGQSIKNK